MRCRVQLSRLTRCGASSCSTVMPALSEQAPRELFRLTHPAFVERYVGALQNARCIAVGLTMTHEQDRHAASLAAFVRAGEFRMKLDADSAHALHRRSSRRRHGPPGAPSPGAR